MSESAMLLDMIRKYDFALKELNLYLDTHPKCSNALMHFKKYRELREKACAEYTAKYGPLTVDMAGTDDCWNWVSGPWPWETEAN
jgi:spore coat protein JB